jgi:hypothetical protein
MLAALIPSLTFTFTYATLAGKRFEFQDHLNQGDAGKTLRAAIEWGRYAELFSYDDETRMFGLDHSAQ